MSDLSIELMVMRRAWIWTRWRFLILDLQVEKNQIGAAYGRSCLMTVLKVSDILLDLTSGCASEGFQDLEAT